MKESPGAPLALELCRDGGRELPEVLCEQGAPEVERSAELSLGAIRALGRAEPELGAPVPGQLPRCPNLASGL